MVGKPTMPLAVCYSLCMPTFPLLDFDPPHPDGWHAVTAPGGYEWWYFDAEDRVNHRQFVAIFFEGFVFHPGYLRADARYRCRPTRVRPALPSDFPCVYFVVYENGRVRQQFMTQFPADQFFAARDRLNVKIGGNTIESTHSVIDLNLSGTPWQLGGRGPRLLSGSTLNGQLRFEPKTFPAVDRRRFLSRTMTAAEHYWQLANPLCDVTANLQIDGETIAFRGRGYHDHNYGTAPLGPGLKRWMWGRTLFEDSATVFHHAEPAQPDLPNETHLLRVDAQGVAEPTIAPVARSRERRTAAGLAYPESVDFDGVLHLREARVVDASPFYLRLQYVAETPNQIGRAFCEIAYPHRLRWPILGRMIEMSIDRTGLLKQS